MLISFTVDSTRLTSQATLIVDLSSSTVGMVLQELRPRGVTRTIQLSSVLQSLICRRLRSCVLGLISTLPLASLGAATKDEINLVEDATLASLDTPRLKRTA